MTDVRPVIPLVADGRSASETAILDASDRVHRWRWLSRGRRAELVVLLHTALVELQEAQRDR